MFTRLFDLRRGKELPHALLCPHSHEIPIEDLRMLTERYLRLLTKVLGEHGFRRRLTQISNLFLGGEKRIDYFVHSIRTFSARDEQLRCVMPDSLGSNVLSSLRGYHSTSNPFVRVLNRAFGIIIGTELTR